MEAMCPDEQLLSVYLDNELPEPWASKLKTHLELCDSCKLKYQALEQISSLLKDDTEDSAPVSERIWQRLEQTAETLPPIPRIWRKPVYLPLPVAVAAAFVFALLSFIVLRGGNTKTPAIMTELRTNVEQSIPVNSMAEVLQYLDAQGSQTEVIVVRLPETQTFTPIGQPELIKAVDYNGRTKR
jgi:hypothetical protein